MKKEKEKEEFREKKRLLEMKHEFDKIKHEFKMEELIFERNSQKLLHEQILERGRIQRAEARRDFMDKYKR